MRVKESKTSPRHLNFSKQLKKTTAMMLLLRVLFLDTPGHPKSACNTVTLANIPYMHITIRNLVHKGVMEEGNFLMDSHPFSHET